MTVFWERLGRAARISLVAGAAAIVVGTIVLGYWLLRVENQVLFADLTPADTVAMTAELDRLKIAYTLSDQGSAGATILVDKNEVYKTRIKLMGKDIPLHGAVGFELFNNSDFGMTEFSQKITYQRALQGELTRTILSLAEIRDARVLLALPEQGLFRQANIRPTASVTLTLKQDQVLRPEQVGGIQRLVAAAVPGIAVQDVTLVDQRGVALTRAAGDGDGDAAGGRLDLKKDTEKYLALKAGKVLERALGAGQALASVDVTLSMDRIQTNTDEVVGAPTKEDAEPTGIVVRARDSSHDTGPPLNTHSSDGNSLTAGGSSQREVEYAVGHRIEQVVSQPGAIRHIEVAVVVKTALNPEQQERLRKMVAASVGASSQRGDTVVVQTLDDLKVGSADTGASVLPAPLEPTVTAAAQAAGKSHGASVSWGMPAYGALLLAVAGIILVGVMLVRRHAVPPAAAMPAVALSEQQRQLALTQLHDWMRQDRLAAGQRSQSPSGGAA